MSHTHNDELSNQCLICQLPAELLIELFTFCARNDAAAPPMLSFVCRLFREVISTSPRIWQLISLNDISISASHAQAKYWMQQSAPLPFDVELNLQSADSLLPLLSPFLHNIDRWRDYSCTGVINEQLRLPRLVRPNSVATLHCLKIRLIPPVESDTNLARSPTFYSCSTYPQTPQHVSMNLNITSLPPLTHLAPLPFVALKITSFSIESPLQPAQFLNFLIACPWIEDMHISSILHEELLRDELPLTIPLLHLRTLLVRNMTSQRVLLSVIYAPALRELYLQNLNVDYELQRYHNTEEGDSDDEEHDFSRSPYSDIHTGMALRIFITRSDPPLEVLDMELSDMRTKDFTWCFNKVHTLQRFRITGSDMSDKVINLFRPFADHNGGVMVRLPRLSELKLYSCQALTADATADALCARVQYTDGLTSTSTAATLSNLTIADCAQLLPGHIDDLRRRLGPRLHMA